MQITVQSRIDANFPDEATVRLMGGVFALQTECARRLLAEGCTQDSITFDEPEQGVEQGVWTMKAKGERP